MKTARDWAVKRLWPPGYDYYRLPEGWPIVRREPPVPPAIPGSCKPCEFGHHEDCWGDCSCCVEPETVPDDQDQSTLGGFS